MKVLVISNSARGHAIAEALARSPQKPEIIAIVTNKDPGMVKLAKEVHVIADLMEFTPIINIAKETKPDFAIIGPEDPICGGLADRLLTVGVHCVAPKKPLARVEASKEFTRKLLKKYEIKANPKFRSFEFSSIAMMKQLQADITRYIEHDLQGNYVVKYDGLKGGKGVKVSGEHLPTTNIGVKYALECLQQCGSVVIEEKLIGVEFSLLSFVSGNKVVDMPAVQDHKRAFAGDTGPNTGGMGTYSDANHSLPFLSDSDMKQASEINRKVAEALMKECGEPYKGILYGGFIAVKNGVRVIEYNARFGDPEALNILPLLKSDFVAICLAIIDGTLSPDMVEFEHQATVCKYLTPKSYPDKKDEKGKTFTMPENIPPNVRVYYGDVTQGADERSFVLGTSRAIGVVGIGENLDIAEQAAEKVCEAVSGPVRFRYDVGTVELTEKRIDTMAKLRRDTSAT
jgi:phosphoribosylamine--glycine ligase